MRSPHVRTLAICAPLSRARGAELFRRRLGHQRPGDLLRTAGASRPAAAGDRWHGAGVVLFPVRDPDRRHRRHHRPKGVGGRRGALVIGVAWIRPASPPLFAALLLFEALRGLGEAFASGAPEAWLASEVGDDHAGQVFLRAGQIGSASYLAGLVASVPLAAVALTLPVVLCGAIGIATGILLALVMRERPFRDPGQRPSWSAFASTARDGIRVVKRRPLLLTILALELCFGAASEGYDRLWEAHLLNDTGLPRLFDGDPVAWFAITNAGSMLLGIGVMELARRRVDSQTHRGATRFLFASEVLVIASRIVFAFAPNFGVALIGRWGPSLAAGFGPVYTAWLTRNIDPAVRATVISAASVCNAGGQILGGPA